mmetsp:Transcript_1802/g.4633  ORF Transcript_1802/g.4633 Transcript_1802/m.4633 type:complete len:108 (-) Transcript_1802:133-456(-)
MRRGRPRRRVIRDEAWAIRREAIEGGKAGWRFERDSSAEIPRIFWRRQKVIRDVVTLRLPGHYYFSAARTHRAGSINAPPLIAHVPSRRVEYATYQRPPALTATRRL